MTSSKSEIIVYIQQIIVWERRLINFYVLEAVFKQLHLYPVKCQKSPKMNWNGLFSDKLDDFFKFNFEDFH